MGCALFQPTHREEPVMDELWLSHYYNALPDEAHQRAEWDDYRDAWVWARRVSRHITGTYDEVEGQLIEIWDDMIGPGQLTWDEVQPIIEHVYAEAGQAAQVLMAS
jgi:hypothetical protein